MYNPFSHKDIKDYLFFYAAVLAIIILFYILNTSFNTVEKIPKKEFDTTVTEKLMHVEKPQKNSAETEKRDQIRLLDKAY